MPADKTVEMMAVIKVAMTESKWVEKRVEKMVELMVAWKERTMAALTVV